MQPPCRPRGLLPSRPGLFELAIALFEDHILQAVELVCRCDVSDCAVQPDVVVIPDARRDTTPGLLEIRRTEWPNPPDLRLSLQRSRPNNGDQITTKQRCQEPLSRFAGRLRGGWWIPGPAVESLSPPRSRVQ